MVARRRDWFGALGGAYLVAERSEEERSGAKWRGRGLGQRNTKTKKLTFKNPFLQAQI